jgi:hypothetical protein
MILGCVDVMALFAGFARSIVYSGLGAPDRKQDYQYWYEVIS